MEESDVKKSLIRRSGEIFVLADHTKIAATSAYTVCGVETIDRIIVDSRSFFGPEQLEALDVMEKQGARVIFAEE